MLEPQLQHNGIADRIDGNGEDRRRRPQEERFGKRGGSGESDDDGGGDDDLCDIDPSKLLLEHVSRHFHGNFSCVGINEAGLSPMSADLELEVYCKSPV